MDKIMCIGKNYFEHAAELNEPAPQFPVVFFKPKSTMVSVQKGENQIQCPLQWNLGAIHYEAELIYKVSGGGFMLSEEEAKKCIKHVSVGLDLTLREKQAELKKLGLPWELSKSFFNSCVIGPWVEVDEKKDYSLDCFSLELNSEPRQKSTLSEMRFTPEYCLSFISQTIPLCDGDILFTGTPKGVGRLKAGDKVELKYNLIKYSVEFA